MSKFIDIKVSFQPILCKLGKHLTSYCSMQYEYGACGPQKDECVHCGKKYVWIYLGREDKMFTKCEVLDDE